MKQLWLLIRISYRIQIRWIFRSLFDVKDMAYGVHSCYQKFMLISSLQSIFYADAFVFCKTSVFHKVLKIDFC
jgi:hypothetical protein